MDSGDNEFKLIKAAWLIDGNGGPPLERGAILFEGDKIKDVGTEEAVIPPEGARTQEFVYNEQTVLPGLVDCHVHLIGFGDGRFGDELHTLPDEVLTLQAASNARAHLYSGVTTVRDCGAKNRTTFMLREAVDMGITKAPRLLLSGRPVAIVGGHLSYFGVEATGVDECRAAVRQLVKEGADFIKITATGGSTRTSVPMRPSFNPDELTAICEEAHKFGKHAAAHCVSSQGIINAVEAGVDTVIHGYHRNEDGSYEYRPEITESIVKRGVYVNPTLGQAQIRMEALESKLESESLSESDQADLEFQRASHEDRLDCVARMLADGVRIACGSDSAWSSYPMGDFQTEIEAQVGAGMSPMEAIVAATRDSARSCWADDQVGTLAEGKQADVLVVKGNPSKNIGALRNVVDVFQAGARVDRNDLL